MTYHIATMFGQKSSLIAHLPVIDSYRLLGAIYDIDKTVLENVHFYACESIFEVLNLALDSNEIIAIFGGCTEKVKNESKC